MPGTSPPGALSSAKAASCFLFSPYTINRNSLLDCLYSEPEQTVFIWNYDFWPMGGLSELEILNFSGVPDRLQSQTGFASSCGEDLKMDRVAYAENGVKNDSNISGVSWGAVMAGAFVAAALSLALLALGTGIGLSAVSPWANSGASASAVGWGAITWLALMELVSASMGGYVAGRLRTKWVRVHAHEVYFRDTAHGFLVWAVSLVIAAAFLTSAATSVIGGAVRTGSAEPSTAGQRGIEASPNAYFVESMLRSTSFNSTQDSTAARNEVGLILANSLRQGNMSPADKSYLAQLIAATTGISGPDAERRVDDVYAQARETADAARKAMAHSMYWTFLALLIGAFCASLAATIGGRQRDNITIV